MVRSTSARLALRYSPELTVFEGLRHRLPLGVGEDQLDLLLHLFEPLVAEARQLDALLEELERLVERHLFPFQPLHDLLELLEGLFELVGLRARRHSGAL